MSIRSGRKAAARVTAVLWLAAGVLGVPAFGAPAPDTIIMPMQMSPEGKNAKFTMSMRKLWAEHAIWTRAYIVSTLSRGKDAAEVEARLLRNQTEIGSAFVPYYGQDAGAKLTGILNEHIRIAGEVVMASKNPTSPKFLDADKRWRANADELAAFLSSTNPNWSKETLLKMFNDHIALTTKQASSRVNKQWAAEISAFDEVYVQALQMGDDLAKGVIKQFPEKI